MQNHVMLPHHKLHAYAVARDLLRLVCSVSIRDATLRDHALRSAKSVCLNCAEGAGRVTRADKARSFAIARAELSEAIAAVEIAAETGDVAREVVDALLPRADRLTGMLTKL